MNLADDLEFHVVSVLEIVDGTSLTGSTFAFHAVFMKRIVFAILLTSIATTLFAADPPPKPWTSSIGAGLAITSGNTDTKNYNLAFATKYDPKTKFVFKADALYLRGDTDGETQVDKASADVRGEYSLSDRTFAFAEVTYLRDPFKGVNYLVAPLAGG